MRNKIELNSGWQFAKVTYEDRLDPAIAWQSVTLPHTFNAIDGADGKGAYYRGECLYKTTLHPDEMMNRCPLTTHIVLRIPALALQGKVYANGQLLASHKGGYSAFCVDLTSLFLQASANYSDLELIISADNSNQSDVYPQTADFTFYGGLYRGVELFLLPREHFCFSRYASPGLKITTQVPDEHHAHLSIEASVSTTDDNYQIRYQIIDRDGQTVAESYRLCSNPSTEICLPDPHLWQGVEDPYLYRLTATLIYRNEQIDQIYTSFGIRDFYVDSEKGFFLNKKPMMLRGVSRHQDWLYEGYALTKEQHKRDAALIKEIGANTIRLAHYQHSEDFYDICDEAGLVVWAEIPYISVESDDPAAFENAQNQMRELIDQNYNHPSICFWGISNEITIGGIKDRLVEHHRALHQLVKESDPTRLTTIAHVSMLPMDAPLHGITDLESYNHYFGWYGGNYEQNETWLDTFHEKYPNICLGLSEYGAEGIITYQPDIPKCRDYSESYQALYHEHMAQILMERPYLWSSYVWNMFDFGCAARDEGGVAGRNNKGLVTMDRQIKKDAFYVYKAYWSKEPFVYIAGRRYAQRATDETCIKVYSNQQLVTLALDGKPFATQYGHHIFEFKHVPLHAGFNHLTATATAFHSDTRQLDTSMRSILTPINHCTDSVSIEKISKKPAIYTLPVDDSAGDGVTNWFDQIETVASDAPMEFSDTHFSVYDKIKDLCASEEAYPVLENALTSMSGMKLNKSMLSMMQDMTLIDLTGMFPVSNERKIPDNALEIVNAELNKIQKPN